MKTGMLLRCALAALCALAPRPALAQAGAGGAQWNYDNYRPKVLSADGAFSFAIRTRWQFDSAYYLQDEGGGTAVQRFAPGSVIRRGFIGAEGRLFRDFLYEYRMDVGVNSGASDAKVNIGRIAYDFTDASNMAIPHVRLNTGIIQPAFTHEDNTSSASLIFLERAASVMAASSIFGGNSARRGAELIFQQVGIFRPGDNLLLAASVTGWEPNGTGGATQAIQRAAYRLWSDGRSNVQIGGSAAQLLDGGGGIAVREYPDIRAGSRKLVGTPILPARGGQLWGLDSEMNLGSFYFGGEYYRFRVEPDALLVPGEPEFSGWYVAASWILTGETRTYVPLATNKQTATFNNPSVAAPFLPSPGQSPSQSRGWGAWELAARYSTLDLNWNAGLAGTACAGLAAGCIRGGAQNIATLGLNWYLSNNFRMIFDYSIIHLDRLDPVGQDIGRDIHFVGTRLQFTN
jgi:phosphate-selective porin OprO and OprP